MIEIEIAFIYFDDKIIEKTKELFDMINIYNSNYLVYYIFYKNYCLFSNIKITAKEAEILIECIETQKGFDLLCTTGLETKFARYVLFHEENVEKEINELINNKFELELKEYVENFVKTNELMNLKQQNKEYIEKIKSNEKNEQIIIESKELLLVYQNLIKEKEQKIEQIEKINAQICEDMQKIPKFLRKIFIKNKGKLIG